MKSIVQNKGSINFSAKWTPKVLTIVFHKNDGSNVTETKTYTFDWNMDDDRLNPMSNLNQRNGYNFNWWNFYANGSDNHNYPFNDIIWTTWFDTQVWNASSKTINLYAKRTPKTITITFDKQGWNGGTSTFYYKYGTNQFYSNYACTSQITSIEKPTRNGYTFVHYYGDWRHGWENGERYAKYDSTEFAWDLDDDIYEDATLYAWWCQNCDPWEWATCVLSAKSETYKVNCTYTTSCKVWYENLQNAWTYHPSCTPKSCPQQWACWRAAHGSKCTTYNRCSSTAIQSTCNLWSWSTNPWSYEYANQWCSSCPAKTINYYTNACETTSSSVTLPETSHGSDPLYLCTLLGLGNTTIYFRCDNGTWVSDAWNLNATLPIWAYGSCRWVTVWSCGS